MAAASIVGYKIANLKDGKVWVRQLEGPPRTRPVEPVAAMIDARALIVGICRP